MDKARPVTPEKQLLKLIEEPRTKNSLALDAGAIKHHSLSLFSFGAWLGRISFSKDRFKRWFRGLKYKQLDIKVINKILGIGVFILTFYFISNFFVSLINLKKSPDLESKTLEARNLISSSETSLLKKAVSYYLEKVRQRDIFKMGAKTPGSSAKSVLRAPTSRIIEATQHLKLVGISWSGDPDVMIEDTKALRTFFLKRGQMIGEVEVQAIFKDKVVLGYGGEEIELR